MKNSLRILCVFLICGTVSGATLSFADGTPAEVGVPADISNIRIEEPPQHASSSYDQLVTLQFGQFRPQSVQIANGTYNFNYGSQISSFMGEAGWAIQLLQNHGSFYFEENLAFSSFSGNAVQSQGQNLQLSSSSYSLYVFGFDTRLMYAADWFPVKWVIPFADGGYQYSVYYQSASSGVESAQGDVGNFVAGGGLRLWLNRRSSLENGGNPLFLSVKVNRIFSNSNSLDLASTSFLGGLSVGL